MSHFFQVYRKLQVLKNNMWFKKHNDETTTGWEFAVAAEFRSSFCQQNKVALFRINRHIVREWWSPVDPCGPQSLQKGKTTRWAPTRHIVGWHNSTYRGYNTRYLCIRPFKKGPSLVFWVPWNPSQFRQIRILRIGKNYEQFSHQNRLLRSVMANQPTPP